MWKPLLVLAVVAFMGYITPTKGQDCDDNEVYSNCTNGGCGPTTCDGLGRNIGCVKMDQKNCKEGYICKEGYLRDENDKCIPKTECPECGGDPNAVSGCGINCGKHCSDLKSDKLKPCQRICKVDACDCRDGYYFDDNTNQCVLPDDCTPACGENEVFSSCINGGCDAKNCSQVGQPVPCVKPKICYPGCLCKEGWLRADDGTCVPKEQCPNSCNKPHEYYDECVKSCDPQTCDSIGQTYNCPIQTTVCKGGCRCEDGYYRNAKGKCIPKKCCKSCGGDPNAKPGCGTNCGRLCSNYKQKDVACSLICKDGCDCKEGYVFDENIKKCVLPENCTPTCGNNEVYSTCANGGCGKRYCSEPPICIDPIKCEGGCVCQDGYTRDDKNNCIPEDECPVSCGGDPNAKPGCGTNCGRLCSNYKKKDVACTLSCQEGGCDCKKDYVFDENTKKCVLPEDCTPTCPKGERYEKCPDRVCEPETCSQLGFSLNCTNDSDGDCQSEPRCICDNGNVRDDDGNCIPKENCPSCGGDPNAVTGCSNYCGKSCSTYKKKSLILCALYCKLNGCDCRNGYVYDENLNKCVKPKQCTKTCGVNEIYSTCENGGCRRRSCSQSVICVRPKECKGGCICQDGYTRDKDNTCIPEDQCPGSCTQPNEVYDVCPAPCPPQRCDVDPRVIRCAAPPKPGDPACKAGCRCVDGYVRNDKGVCVTRDQCDECEGKEEEEEKEN